MAIAEATNAQLSPGHIPANASAEKADRLLHDLVPDGLRTPLHVALIAWGGRFAKRRPRSVGSVR